MPEADRSTVADRVKKGESKKKIAKSLGVTPRAVTKIAKSVNRKADGNSRIADAKVATGEAQQVPSKQHPVEKASAVPAAALPGHEEEPSPHTPFDEAIAEVQAMLENFSSCHALSEAINRLVPGIVDPNKNKELIDWLAKRFTKALKVLQDKAVEFREQPADDEPDEDDGEHDQDDDADADKADYGRPSLRAS